MVQAICLGIGLVFRLDFERRNVLKLCMCTAEAIYCNLPVYAAEKLKPIKQLFSALNSLWCSFPQSPKHTYVLQEVQEVVHHPKLAQVQPGNTKWTSHYRAVRAIVKCLQRIVATLQHTHQDSGNLSSEAGGLLLTFQDHKSILLLFAIEDILNPVCKLALKLQHESGARSV